MEKTKLLIVDDEEGMRESLADILQEKGYDVAVAPSGTEALAEAKNTLFDAALIDISLPDMDGLEVLETFLRDYPDMVCCIITGHASLQNAIGAIGESVNN